MASGSSSSLDELKEDVEGWDGAGESKEEGRPPVERFKGPDVWPLSEKLNLLVRTGIAE